MPTKLISKDLFWLKKSKFNSKKSEFNFLKRIKIYSREKNVYNSYNNFFKDGSLYITTPMDPLFLFIPRLEKCKKAVSNFSFSENYDFFHENLIFFRKNNQNFQKSQTDAGVFVDEHQIFEESDEKSHGLEIFRESPSVKLELICDTKGFFFTCAAIFFTCGDFFFHMCGDFFYFHIYDDFFFLIFWIRVGRKKILQIKWNKNDKLAPSKGISPSLSSLHSLSHV